MILEPLFKQNLNKITQCFQRAESAKFEPRHPAKGELDKNGDACKDADRCKNAPSCVQGVAERESVVFHVPSKVELDVLSDLSTCLLRYFRNDILSLSVLHWKWHKGHQRTADIHDPAPVLSRGHPIFRQEGHIWICHKVPSFLESCDKRMI